MSALQRCCEETFRWLYSLTMGAVGSSPLSDRKRSAASVHVKSLLYGLERVGKTAILYRLKLGLFIPTVPSVDVINETFDVPVVLEGRRYCAGGVSTCSAKLSIWECGRWNRLLPTWRGCHRLTSSVIFVIDGCDKKRLSDARDELLGLFFEEHFQVVGAKFLVFVNKQDIRGAMSRVEVEEFLHLPMKERHRWKVVGCSAVSGEGLWEGVAWLGGLCSNPNTARIRVTNEEPVSPPSYVMASPSSALTSRSLLSARSLNTGFKFSTVPPRTIGKSMSQKEDQSFSSEATRLPSQSRLSLWDVEMGEVSLLDDEDYDDEGDSISR